MIAKRLIQLVPARGKHKGEREKENAAGGEGVRPAWQPRAGGQGRGRGGGGGGGGGGGARGRHAWART
ncbi:unnamed protein product [Closterium sp. NIES-54]